MLLTNYNIQDVVMEQMNLYLSQQELSFTELKNKIISKAPLPKTHSAIITKLGKSRDADINKVQKALEMQAYKNQIAEDEKQRKLDALEESKDDDDKRHYKRDLDHIPTKIKEYETECQILQNKLHRQLTTPPTVEVSQHRQFKKKASSPELDQYNRVVSRLRNSISEYQTKIEALYDEKNSLQQKLTDIQKRTLRREDRKTGRSIRERARIGYKNSGEGIQDCLSTKNRASLNKSIQDQRTAITTKYTELIQEAEQINFSTFLDALPKHLASHSKLSTPESEALQSILNVMTKHLDHLKDISSTQYSLSSKKQSISSHTVKLAAFKSQLKSLQENNPDLTSNNEALTARNSSLNILLANHKSWQQKLTMPILLLAAMTFIFCIPLILTISGVIPLFISAPLLYTLVSAPTALLFAGTLATGIAAVVYMFKARSNDSEIKKNQDIINTNINQMKKNNTNLHTLEKFTIPNMETQIRKDEAIRKALEASLKESQSLAEETLAKARHVEPVSSTGSTFFGSKAKDIPALESDQSSEEESDEELKEESLSESP